MIRFVNAKDIDKERWDEVVENAPNGNIFSYSWYLDALCDTWHGLVRGDYEQVMAMPVQKKMSYEFMFQPFFSRQIGVFGKDVATSTEVTEFLNAIPKEYRFIQVGFEPRPADLFDGYDVEEVVFQKLEMNRDYDEIYSAFSTNTKRNIKKAIKANLTVKPVDDLNNIISLFMANKGGELGFSENDFKHLLMLMTACVNHDRGWAIGAYDEDGVLHATSFFMLGQKTLVYLNGASNAYAKKNGASHFLMNHMIEKWCNKAEALDFGGSKVPSVAKFYHTFGSADQTYCFITKDRLPRLVKLVRKLKQQF